MTDGLTSIESRFGPKETLDRLEAEVQAKGLAGVLRGLTAKAAGKA